MEGRTPMPLLGEQIELVDLPRIEEHLAGLPGDAGIDQRLPHAEAVHDLQRPLRPSRWRGCRRTGCSSCRGRRSDGPCSPSRGRRRAHGASPRRSPPDGAPARYVPGRADRPVRSGGDLAAHRSCGIDRHAPAACPARPPPAPAVLKIRQSATASVDRLGRAQHLAIHSAAHSKRTDLLQCPTCRPCYSRLPCCSCPTSFMTFAWYGHLKYAWTGPRGLSFW